MASSKPEKTVPGKPVLSKGRVKNLLRVARIVGPVVAPYAVQAASAAREGYDRMRARRLGVPVTDLASFSGKGGALHARIAGITDVLRDLRERSTDPADVRATEQAASRLAELTAAVRAAERMPTSRRRTTHRAVAKELDIVENDLLRRLGV